MCVYILYISLHFCSWLEIIDLLLAHFLNSKMKYKCKMIILHLNSDMLLWDESKVGSGVPEAASSCLKYWQNHLSSLVWPTTLLLLEFNFALLSLLFVCVCICSQQLTTKAHLHCSWCLRVRRFSRVTPLVLAPFPFHHLTFSHLQPHTKHSHFICINTQPSSHLDNR